MTELPLFQFEKRVVTEETKKLYEQIFFRQSFIQDYLMCPWMATNRWLGNGADQHTYMAAVMGTAGHEVIYRIHLERRRDVDRQWLIDAFELAFHNALKREPDKKPSPSKAYETIFDKFQTEQTYYVDLLQNYQAHPTNRSFHTTMHEQQFVLSIGNPDAEKAPYIIYGTIDQAGFDEKGAFILRDIKFRDNATRYSRRELDLNIQMTTYAAALRFGRPACDNCKPRYLNQMSDDNIGYVDRQLVYNGPCEECTKKIRTRAWPLMYPERCEMIWMFDFEKRTKDEFDRFVINKDLPKVKSPTTNRMVYQQVENPEWEKGAKKGDMKGQGFLPTFRSPSKIQVFMEDILRVCDQVRAGVSYRLPSKACNWCTQYNACQNALRVDQKVQEQKDAAMYSASDPFGD